MKATRSRYRHPSEALGVRPELAFAAATLAVFVVWGGLIATASSDLAMPIIATMFLVFAAGLAVVARHHRDENPKRVTYADVAGALTLIGLFAAATIDPDQLVRIIADGSTDD